MTDAIFIFTFSPVQAFISEARRTADLYTGSQVLVSLAKATIKKVIEINGRERLIYPALPETNNTSDLPPHIPNKVVAKVSFENCEAIADEMRIALLKRWNTLAEEAREHFLQKTSKPFDEDIWERQIKDEYFWEIYWTAALMGDRGYTAAYKEAERGLFATKLTRPFMQFSEPGFKDTLSGKREALHPKAQDGRQYWLSIGRIPEITPITIRPSTATHPREQLDAIGIIKRFHPELSEKQVKPFRGFPSTSSIASWTFLEAARTFAPAALETYKREIQQLLPESKYKVRPLEPDWPFDGDLLYMDTLRLPRLTDSYGKKFDEAELRRARTALQELYASLHREREKLKRDGDERYLTVEAQPSSYYAVIVLDGDNIGKHLRTLNEDGHRQFSQQLGKFSMDAPQIVEKFRARVVYNGGDDVLALAPLDTAFACTYNLANTFHQGTGRTASAGIAIAHHRSPLRTALRAARRAEGEAKGLRVEKHAICITALKRSGEPIVAQSGWEHTGPYSTLVKAFQTDALSSQLLYALEHSIYALPDADDKFEAELRRLLKRHWQKGTQEEKDVKAREVSKQLRDWAASFPVGSATQIINWLALARFTAKGGRG